MYTFIFIVLLYDPLFTSIFGGTVGHMFQGIRVKKESDEARNIPFFSAMLRYAAKVLLGIISLLTVSGHPKKKAIHDMMAGSVVVFADPLLSNLSDSNAEIDS
jgi:uncharacterized RDD family membrane protein YckC